MNTNYLQAAWLAAVLSLSIGCGSGGPPVTHVTGKVTFDGQPVSSGHVVFRSKDGKTISSAGPVVDGQFEFESLPGEKTVMITALREVPGKFDESNPGERVPLTEQYIPPKYNAKSDLTIVVDIDDSNFDFELQST